MNNTLVLTSPTIPLKSMRDSGSKVIDINQEGLPIYSFTLPIPRLLDSNKYI